MDNLLIISSECSYIIYMMLFFKTKYSVAHPMSRFNNDLFNHPIGIKQKPQSMICMFGKIMSIIMSIFLIIRWYLIKDNNIKQNYLKYHKIIIYIMISLCLINFNALLYMLPIFILEHFVY